MASLRPVLDIAVCEKRWSKERRNAGSSGVVGALKISDVIYAINRFPPRILPDFKQRGLFQKFSTLVYFVRQKSGIFFLRLPFELKAFFQA